MGDVPDRLMETTLPRSRDVSDKGRQPILRPTLSLVYGHDINRIGVRYTLERETLRLNRNDPAFPGGPFNDPEMSRRHAEVIRESKGVWKVLDRGSTNGTFVNGTEVAADGHVLSFGDLLEVGSNLFLFHETLNPSQDDAAIPNFIGISDGARSVRSAVGRYAASDAPVVILGETGVGKELVAAALARLGRPDGPYVAFNASATPESLVDATLFGHERGAFTDARQARPGMFRSAHSGTLFLDEIGDLPMETQVKLLRVLEDGKVHPLGATKPVEVDVRIVSAAHTDLLDKVGSKDFRGDLYSRLSYVVVRVPPLRMRFDDVPVLALHFSGGRPFAKNAILELMRHPWPFNVRELKAVVGQMSLDAPSTGRLEIPEQVSERLTEHRSLFEESSEGTSTDRIPSGGLDMDKVEQALSRHRGNMTKAAEELGRDRSHFYRVLRKLGLDPQDYR